MPLLNVAVIATEGFSSFHLSVPIILFGDTVSSQKLFKLKICAEVPGMIGAKDGMAVKADFGLEGLLGSDIVIVPFWEHIHQRPSSLLLESLISAKSSGAQIVGLCLGTYVLAYAGLLDGKRAATHWEFEKDFVRLFPSVQLDVNVLFVEDDGVVTSAGTAAAMDCCLYLIRQRFGAVIANQIARRMVIPPYRDGGQSQYIEQLVPHNTADTRINALLEFLQQNLKVAHDLDSLAASVSMSRRTLTRHFHKATGMSVIEWLSTERLHKSQELLESTDLSIELVSEYAGFKSPITFRQMFREKMGVSPIEWRKTFRGNY
ncbi:TPA: helix-turn-helix domain-containing protein [Klebsiella michiganensis]|uniref:GlxA family transcriptional regulator n=1 Tax=Klebsiella michiganensis TaxID=1134687 RepID=UPI002295E3EC|nr:helix-turn-helix domain-containing protein [Klebsiella michiganensis]ELS4492839.1 helix-turn-helix domain-containing protein [Klebsiella michiganensis]ELS4625838.1 helix-turn-helix domain-containing protein [Klebsiella michiganensis]MDM6772582.1 helix-turn-helix domain-containing protein [Klebsiella michiganensis]HCQ8473295.1 helix-turn-helix domain-containing protein [Klebsiella michiganensis]HCU0766879.1 helix-turn-helix domain-containing protein [Klebsiella michiganensis]